MLKCFFSPSTHQQQARRIYAQIVAAARQAVFYKDWQVPDTLDGRFDMLVLHLYLVLDACGKHREFCRDLSEAFFSDMDRSLREMGVSDTGVGKRIKAMAQAFYGRQAAYAEAGSDEKKLMEALRRNVWREKPAAGEAVAALAGYMRRNAGALRIRGAEAVIRDGFTCQE
ncbi:MAG: ubiquinol-cytochrome C chaperone [Pseudomonadota bacterium]|nr:ubiquinol-cytochrome C chaperone [Pseudomonadota bacterium]MDE3038676.1 ubiquinol-cytochrome C chaperone [Pseudomonadota bacterium]